MPINNRNPLVDGSGGTGRTARPRTTAPVSSAHQAFNIGDVAYNVGRGVVGIGTALGVFAATKNPWIAGAIGAGILAGSETPARVIAPEARPRPRKIKNVRGGGR